MRDYKRYGHTKRNGFAVLTALMAFLAYGYAGTEDFRADASIAATVFEVERAGVVFDKPQAFRLSTPTYEQMERLESLRACARGRADWYAER